MDIKMINGVKRMFVLIRDLLILIWAATGFMIEVPIRVIMGSFKK